MASVAVATPALGDRSDPVAETTASAKKTAKKALKVAKKTSKQQGPQGPEGPQGPAGAAGSDATGLTMGTMAMTASVTRFTPLGGTGGSGGSVAPVPGITPPKDLTMGQFSANIPGMAGVESIAVTVQKDGVDTAISCTVTAPATSCVAPGTLALPAGTLVGVKLVANALGATRIPSWSWLFTG